MVDNHQKNQEIYANKLD